MDSTSEKNIFQTNMFSGNKYKSRRKNGDVTLPEFDRSAIIIFLTPYTWAEDHFGDLRALLLGSFVPCNVLLGIPCGISQPQYHLGWFGYTSGNEKNLHLYLKGLPE